MVAPHRARDRARTPPGCARRCDRRIPRCASTSTRSASWRSLIRVCPARPAGFSAAPDVVEHPRLRGCDRMDAVGLEHRLVLGEALEQERHQRGLARLGDVGEGRIEALAVSRAVVRRHAHADEQHARARFLRGERSSRRDSARIASRLPPRKSVVAAELDHDDGRTVLRQQRVEARAATGGRVAADAGVDDEVADSPRTSSRCCSSVGHAGVGGKPVARRNAVAEHQDDRWRRRCPTHADASSSEHTTSASASSVSGVKRGDFMAHSSAQHARGAEGPPGGACRRDRYNASLLSALVDFRVRHPKRPNCTPRRHSILARFRPPSFAPATLSKQRAER